MAEGGTLRAHLASTTVSRLDRGEYCRGNGRDSLRSYVQFLRVAQGSLKELETHVLIAERVGVVSTEDAMTLLDRAETEGKILRALIRKLSESL
jgi:four helix bundle protein